MPRSPGLHVSPADPSRGCPPRRVGWLLEAITGAGRLSAQKWPPRAGPPALASVSGQPSGCRRPVPRQPPRGLSPPAVAGARSSDHDLKCRPWEPDGRSLGSRQHPPRCEHRKPERKSHVQGREGLSRSGPHPGRGELWRLRETKAEPQPEPGAQGTRVGKGPGSSQRLSPAHLPPPPPRAAATLPSPPHGGSTPPRPREYECTREMRHQESTPSPGSQNQQAASGTPSTSWEGPRL